MTNPSSHSSWARVPELLERAAALSGTERANFIESACGGDLKLRRQLERLLAANEKANDFLVGPKAVPLKSAKSLVTLAPRTGDVVGRYTLGRPIGQGGMGTVYEAVREGLSRAVALKLLDPTLASHGALLRFRFEAEVLGRLEHPSIALVHEAGEDDNGRAFIAMELVEGARDVTKYAREAQLDTRAILTLFREVCAAVAFAHEKGVIHRDLKPSNILVDATGRVKVIDFGVARWLDADAGSLTREGEVVGTLAYMSPEQLEGRASAVDVRCDVYALGALLHELLAGRRPRELQGIPFSEALRRIREEEPPALATLVPNLPRELGWITAKALEREPARRYASVLELALDIDRFLCDEAVRAGAATATYRMAKFVRRHRVGVASAAALAVILVGGFVAALIAERQARALADRAVSARNVERERADAIARELDTNREILELQSSWLHAASLNDSGRDVRVADVLDGAARVLDERCFSSTSVEAELRFALASAYSKLKIWDGACTQIERAWSAVAAGGELAADKRELLDLEWCGAAGQAGKLDEALTRARAALAVTMAKNGAAALATVRWENVLAELLMRTRDYETAEFHLRAALSTIEGTPADHGDDAYDARLDLSRVLRGEGRLDEALREAQRLERDAVEHYGKDHFNVCMARDAEARAYSQLLQHESAAAIFESLLADYERRFGVDDQMTLGAASELSTALCDGHLDLPRAELLARRAVDGTLRRLGASHALSESRLARLGSVLTSVGKPDEGLAKMRQVHEARIRRLGANDPKSLEMGSAIAQQLYSIGRLDDAANTAQETFVRSASRLGPSNNRTLNIANTLGSIFFAQHDPKRASDCFAFVLVGYELTRDRYENVVLTEVNNLAQALSAADEDAEAACYFEDLVARQNVRGGPRSVHIWVSADKLAAMLNHMGDSAGSRALAAQLLDGLRGAKRPDPPRLARLLLVRANAAVACGDAEFARGDYEEALVIAQTQLSVDDPTRASVESAYAAFVARERHD